MRYSSHVENAVACLVCTASLHLKNTPWFFRPRRIWTAPELNGAQDEVCIQASATAYTFSQWPGVPQLSSQLYGHPVSPRGAEFHVCRSHPTCFTESLPVYSVGVRQQGAKGQACATRDTVTNEMQGDTIAMLVTLTTRAQPATLWNAPYLILV